MSHHTGESAYEAEALGRRNHADLLVLRDGWGEAYDLGVEYPDHWSARRKDNGRVLDARSADDLTQKIYDDYWAGPVPRQGAVSDG